ncbi:MAG: MMPL family transporter [Bacteroidetes bacterium]|nr:MMPL family transporter [Bacteroidota bacterium]
MWLAFSRILLRNKFSFTIGIVLMTMFMGYKASKMELSYEFAKILPENDQTFIEYQRFKKQFGEDGNVMVIGFEDKNFFTLNKFNDWFHISKTIKIISGIKDVLSVPTVYKVVKNDSIEKLEFKPLVSKLPVSQKEVDSLKVDFLALPFYEGIVYNKELGSNLMAITFNKASLNSKRRIDLVKEIKILIEAFGQKHHLTMHYSGMPYIRSQMMEKISKEMTLFLILAIIITGFILWLFFRSVLNVFFSLLIVTVGVIWSVGFLELFGYKITVLSGLIAPLIIVIGIPNCIFLINKYQIEFLRHRNRLKAITAMINTIGVTLFLANVTTAIGFGVLYFTKSSMLVEFGVVAALSVMATYFITLILIPVILLFLPLPKARHTKHLDSKKITQLLRFVDNIVHQKRKAIYLITAIVTLFSLVGMLKINFIGYVVDDLPKNDPVYTDLHFFENAFKGVLPFEIAIDTKKPNGLFANNARTVYKIKAMQNIFSEYKEFSKPLSIVEAIRFSYQAFKGGNKKYYKLPAITDLKSLSDYSGSLTGQDAKLKSFLDNPKRITRVSYQMADIGSKRIKELTRELKPRIDSIFDPGEYHVSLTGHSLVFLKSNDYLLSNLLESLLIEVILIALVGMALFRSVRIIILSKIPCLIPLIITAGIMGFLDIRFKPSTILIFSIAFGISSDGTIYLLTKYRQELLKNKGIASLAISAAIKETGLSMVYTTIILFFGFGVFSISSFGGTAALGVLISLTLVISLFTNIILLPAILLSIDNKRSNKKLISANVVDE